MSKNLGGLKMIKRIEELKETKEFVEAEASNIRTTKRIIVIDILNALITVAENKDKLEGFTFSHPVIKKEKDFNNIIAELEDVIEAINNTKNIYNYFFNQTYSDLYWTFNDLLDLVFTIEFTDFKQRLEENSKKLDKIFEDIDKHEKNKTKKYIPYEELTDEEKETSKKEIVKQHKQEEEEFSALISNISSRTEDDKWRALDLARKPSAMDNFKNELEPVEREELLYNYS